MKLLITMLICSVISACASTQIHLYRRYLSDQETITISTAIEQQGFDVIPNTLAFPDEIQQSTLLYSPFIEKEDGVNVLLSSLESLGWEIPTVQALFTGNHFYTKDSAGLFLLPEGAGTNDKIAAPGLVNEYQSEECDASIALRLNKDESYQFVYKNGKAKPRAKLTGKWKIISYPYIGLSSVDENWWFYLEIQQTVEVDQISRIKIVTLTPLDKHYAFPSCSFVFGQRL